MKRSFLSELGLEDEVIDKIMAEHGKTTQRLQDKIGAKDTEIQTLQGELDTANGKLSNFEKIDVEKLKSEAEEWKSKYENFERDNAVNDFFKDYKFTSDLAKKATINEFKAQNFELKDGKFDGADKFMKQFVKDNETAFVKEDPTTTEPQQNAYSYTPAGGSNGGTDPFLDGLNNIFGKGE
ncbi:Phage minor structural protein GP20 [Peptostreptococcus russellii]|uniref:Phage minor structural protein GP20 n=1 Tax=Peptostreptococcus russellii TaxID=215200 RepID=A0A1H8JJH9_9FIRM|nr:phage scaffolding protein [Peptostreptococcus russellii]SEN80437.1 Phage minor structural protein GP20 [Peptostreptococcus russellii]